MQTTVQVDIGPMGPISRVRVRVFVRVRVCVGVCVRVRVRVRVSVRVGVRSTVKPLTALLPIQQGDGDFNQRAATY